MAAQPPPPSWSSQPGSFGQPSAQFGQPPPGQFGQPAKPHTGLITGGVIAIVLALVVAAVGIGLAVAGALDTEPQPVAEAGTIVAAEAAGEEFSIYATGGFGDASSCQVTGPDGGEVPTETILGTETLELNGRRFVVSRIFAAEDAGTHSVRCPGSGFWVGPRLAIFRTVGLVLGGVFGGLALGVIGVVLLIIGLSRRKKSRAAGWSPGGPPPPGGFGALG